MKKIILPEQTYFVTTNTASRRWVFARRVTADRDLPLRRGWGSPPSRWVKPQTRTRGSLSAERRSCTFTGRNVVPDPRSCMIAIDNLVFYRKKFGFLLHGYVLMPDHVHLLLTVGEKGTISEIMRDWKSRVAFEINRSDKNVRGALWQRDFWEHAIRNDLDFVEKLNYIHQNPMKAEFVQSAEDWEFSSARWYAGMESCFAIDNV